jgi:hypothetical protein
LKVFIFLPNAGRRVVRFPALSQSTQEVDIRLLQVGSPLIFSLAILMLELLILFFVIEVDAERNPSVLFFILRPWFHFF